MKKTLAAIGAMLVASCGQANQAGNEQNSTVQGPATETPVAPPVAPDNAATNVSLPDDRTPLEEPKGPIDPKSAEAAGQVVQHYGALIEQGRWTESRALWSDAEAAKAFERNFRTYADVQIEIGDLGEPEGAAGSIYVIEPVTFYGKKNGSGDFRRTATVTVRRVNDVPSSTEAQRRWHIERIDWKS